MSSSSMPTRRGRRPQSRGLAFAVTTTAVIIAFATFTSSTYTVDAASRAGLRGPQHHDHQQQLTTQRQIPQHGNKRPNRPANLPPHMLPPHDGHGRFLSAGVETLTTTYQNNGAEKGRTHENASREVRELAKRGRGGDDDDGAKVNSSKGKEIKLSDTEKNNLKRPKKRQKQQEKQQQQKQQTTSSLVDENEPARQKLIEEVNAWRHHENQILKQRQRERKKDKPKKQQNKQKNRLKKQQNRKKDKDKPKDDGKKNKDNNKNGNDKKDKDKKDKDKVKKNKKDKDKKDKNKPNKNDGKVDKPDKDEEKPNKNNGNGKKPNKNKPDKIEEPKKDKPKPNNISFGGGSNSENLRPDPTPRPTRRPKPAKNDNTNNVVSVSANKPANSTPRPTRRPKAAKNDNTNDVVVVSVPENKPADPTPRPTKRPKPAKNDNTNDVSDSSGNSGGSSEWNFVKSLADTSSQFDGFERTSGMDWDISSNDPWSLSNTYSYEGAISFQSGINSNRYNLDGGKPVFSNATLTTPMQFEGGVLTFMILAGQLQLPNEAFFVSVDGKVELPPALTNANPDGWVEYSVVVPEGTHKVTWSHVYNPFGMESLPLSTNVVGLWMDDLRYAPFTSDRLDNNANVLDLSDLKMTNNADGVDSAVWKVDSTGVVASTSDFKNEIDGSADIQFVLHSRFGGTLKYKVKADTTAPHDDFAILFNGDVRDAVFGEMVSFEHRELVVPPGKQVVTLRHRKNPGRFGGGLLNSLGEVWTMGKTWLGDLSFVENVY